jgi:hypothetical protein
MQILVGVVVLQFHSLGNLKNLQQVLTQVRGILD